MYITTDNGKEKHKIGNNNKHIFGKSIGTTQSMIADNFHYLHETFLLKICLG
jgi:hypothetical protein